MMMMMRCCEDGDKDNLLKTRTMKKNPNMKQTLKFK